jgi:transcriptional regulator with XRE-family HTH domain
MADSDREARRRFAANIERLRRRGGSSVEGLAARSGVDADELTQILAADREAGYGTIAALAGALEVEPGELFEGISWVPGEEGRAGGLEVEGADG